MSKLYRILENLFFRICESTKGVYFIISDFEDNTGSKEHLYFGAGDLVKYMCQLAIFYHFYHLIHNIFEI